MLERSISDAGGTFLFCDTDSAAVVSAKRRKRIAMPDGAKPITALSWSEVQGIVDRFESLNPYNPKLIPGSILKVHKLNWDRDKQRRQLFGYSIAAKRYALYTKTPNDIEIVEPKAHGLGYFYPPKDSRKGWNRDVPQWIFEAWDWIMRGVLGLKRTRPAWFDLPVMMKLTLSTPHHALKNLAKGSLSRPNNFMMLPQLCRFGIPENVDPNKFTLITHSPPIEASGSDQNASTSMTVTLRPTNSPMNTSRQRRYPKPFSCFWTIIRVIRNRRVLGRTGAPAIPKRGACFNELTLLRTGLRSI
jgi:hypothetical protein